jgi:predicted lipid-binding transport protein (Tim44 family)
MGLDMILSKRLRGLAKVLAVALAFSIPAIAAISEAPPPTATAPNGARPFERSMAQPGQNMGAPAAAAAKGGFFNRPGMGLLGGLAAGFLGAGLLGMLFGGGLFSGLGGFASIIGLLLQVGLVVLLVRLAMKWWQRRNAPAAAYAGPSPMQAQEPVNAPQANFRNGLGFGAGGGAAAPLQITPDDYQAFERLLGDVQAAWSNEDMTQLERLATPEMVSYFAGDLKANAQRGVVNKVTDVKLLQGDLAEAWREGDTDYATVALRFGLVDKTLDRASGRVVEGSDRPEEATEIWTFARHRGGPWELSGIQQA